MSNVEKVFEMLGVKPYERFEIKFEKGYSDEKIIRYFYDDKLGLHNEVKGVTSYLGNTYLSEILCSIHKIIKLPPKLLTDEEKEFLKNFMFDSLKKVEGRAIIMFTIQELGGAGYALGLNALRLKFNGLEFDKEYTKEELGL